MGDVEREGGEQEDKASKKEAVIGYCERSVIFKWSKRGKFVEER